MYVRFIARLPLNLLGIVFGCLIVMQLNGCQSNADYHPEERVATYTLHGDNTRLQKMITRQRIEHGQEGDQNGLYLLQEGLSAFMARIAMIDNADVSLDLQYYIFSNDISGKLILGKLLNAADRGVRVRVLVDDLGAPIQDPWFAVMDQHPNIEIRVFNPVVARSGLPRTFQQAFHFGRINHRMHNKLMVADGVAIVTGGRNIGDPYFSNDETFFQDVDIFCFGPVVSQATNSFDTYWNHEASVPLNVILKAKKGGTLTDLRKMGAEYLYTVRDSEFTKALEHSQLGQDIVSGEITFEWGQASLYADPPDKATKRDEVDPQQFLGAKLKTVLNQAREQLLISSAYFIPGENGLAFLSDLEKRGVKVSVLTNALSTTDVAVVHSGYSQYRKPLLEAGIQLWELRLQAGEERRIQWFKGRSRASLHAKSFVIDDDKVIIGSVNLDGRSLIQNTEIGVYIHSNKINQQLADTYKEWTRPNFAWRLSLNEDDDLQWQAQDKQGNLITEYKDPESSGWQRFKVWLLSWLPIEQQI
ncbi:phospholipase D family protein [Aestuariicella hydrocarbonica]|uniref:Phospholipase D family protein n=1 Tax=Pseudomaricurvus hydrocarbonicus TaxID=1470433 RepID=A0A9E5MLV8_9GAMM|nr:phospholipase D family protein [Aestuariicella hydrocarbonica]NHO65603.1 phospholipase D family protein [Aestuariicella hydrocarbonica]